MLENGYIQIYTGDGKGKTTASLGLALRALGHGWKVMIIQFAKGDQGTTYGEIASSHRFSDNLEVRQFGLDRVCYSHNMNIGKKRLGMRQGSNNERQIRSCYFR